MHLKKIPLLITLTIFMVFFLEVTSDSHQSEKKNCPRALLTATSIRISRSK